MEIACKVPELWVVMVRVPLVVFITPVMVAPPVVTVHLLDLDSLLANTRLTRGARPAFGQVFRGQRREYGTSLPIAK